MNGLSALQTHPETAQRAHWGSGLVLIGIVALWLYGWVGNFVLTLQLGRYVDETWSVSDRSTPLAGAAFKVLMVVAILALLAAIVLAVNAEKTAPLLNLAALLSPWIVLYPVFVYTRGLNFARQDILFPLLITACFFARPSVRQVGRLIVALSVISAGASVVLGIIASDIALMPPSWNTDKAILGDESLAGIYGHSNQLGTILALSVPFVVYLYSGTKRNIYLATIIAALVWSTSRSSLASVATFAVVALMARDVRSPDHRNRNVAVLVSAILAGIALALWLTLTTTDPTAYTNRGRLWLASVNYWYQSPWLGWGPDILSTRNQLTAQLQQIPNSSHDLWLTFALSGGLLALAALAIAGVSITLRASAMYRDGEVLPLSFIVLLVLLSIAEDPLRVLHTGPQAFIVWTGLALVFCIPRGSAPDSGHSLADLERTANKMRGQSKSPEQVNRRSAGCRRIAS